MILTEEEINEMYEKSPAHIKNFIDKDVYRMHVAWPQSNVFILQQLKNQERIIAILNSIDAAVRLL